MQTWLWASVLSLLPIAELRGGLPYLLAGGVSWYAAYPFCVLMNALVAPVAYVFLDTVHKLLYRWGFYARLFDRLIERSRSKLHAKVERFGFLGVILFVGIPLPITGAWSGTLGAWVLGLDRKKTMLAVTAGTALAGLIVSAVYFAGVEAFDFVIKHV